MSKLLRISAEELEAELTFLGLHYIDSNSLEQHGGHIPAERLLAGLAQHTDSQELELSLDGTPEARLAALGQRHQALSGLQINWTGILTSIPMR